MTRDEIKTKLIQLISGLFPEQGVDTDILEYVDLIDDMGMDSITFISIVVEIESRFNITVPDDMLLMENFRNIADICSVIVNELETIDTGEENNVNDKT